MKKAITIFTLFVFAMTRIQTSFAQETGTTKEFNFDPPSLPGSVKAEAIAWIKKTLKTCCNTKSVYGDFTIRNVEVSPCEISWEEYRRSPDLGIAAISKISIKLSKKQYWTSESGNLIANTDVVTKKDLFGYDDPKTSNSFYLIGLDSLAEKMTLEISSLSTFCDE